MVLFTLKLTAPAVLEEAPKSEPATPALVMEYKLQDAPSTGPLVTKAEMVLVVSIAVSLSCASEVFESLLEEEPPQADNSKAQEE